MTRSLSEQRRRDIFRGIPAARFAAVDEVASAVHWLAAPDTGYVTGAVIPVDGGLGMGH